MKKLITIVGPTGTGKSNLAASLCQRFRGEIVNADSRQIYRYLDIGTAKPNKLLRETAPHHLLDIIDPDAEFSLGEYRKLAFEAIKDIQSREKIPFLVGGSGQYVWAVLEGWVVPPVAKNVALRRHYEALALEESGRKTLFDMLTEIDKAAAENIGKSNIRRIIRALEVIDQSGSPFSEQKNKTAPPFDTLIIGLTIERKKLYAIIDSRIDAMIKEGWIKEVEELLKNGYSVKLPALSSIGYRQIGGYLNNQSSWEEMINKTKTATHRYVRQQYNWFKLSDNRIHWYNLENINMEDIEKLIGRFINGHV